MYSKKHPWEKNTIYNFLGTQHQKSYIKDHLKKTSDETKKQKRNNGSTSARSWAAETKEKEGTASVLFTSVVMKSLPDSAKSHVMQAAKIDEYNTLIKHLKFNKHLHKCIIWVNVHILL